MLTDDIYELANLAALYEKGLPPVVGGALDQCKGFTDGCVFLWNEQAALEPPKVF